jgi:hypothetical protein
MSDTHDRDRDRQSLRDLAKLSQQAGPLSSAAPASSARIMPPPSSGVADNSGLIDLERLSEAIRSADEVKSDAPGAAFEGAAPTPAPTVHSNGAAASPVAASDLTPLSPSVRVAEPAEGAAANAVAPVQAAAPSPAAAPASKVPLAVGAAVLVLVGAFLATRKNEVPAPTAAPSAAAPVAEVAPAPAPVPVESPKVEAAPVVVEATKPAMAVAKAEPKSEDSAAEAQPVPAAGASVVPSAKGGASAKAATGAKTDKSFVDEMAAAVTGKLEANVATTDVAAAGPSGPAAGIAKPGTGQVSAAFAKVKGNAHACLGGQEIEVKTVVTFGSDGKVTKVAVANAPDPAMASCIEGAVTKATVPPFTDPSFSAPLTVR